MTAAKFSKYVIFTAIRDVELSKVAASIVDKDADVTLFASQPKVVRFTDSKLGWHCKLASYPQSQKVVKDIYSVPSFYVAPEGSDMVAPKNVWVRIGMQVTKASSSSEGGFVVYPSMAMIPLVKNPRRPTLWTPPMELEGVRQRDILGMSNSNEDEEESTASGEKKKKRRNSPVVWNPRCGKCTYVVQVLVLKSEHPEPEHTMVFDHPDVVFTCAFEHDKEPVKVKKPKKEEKQKCPADVEESSSDDEEKEQTTKLIKKLKSAATTPTPHQDQPDLVMSLLGEQ